MLGLLGGLRKTLVLILLNGKTEVYSVFWVFNERFERSTVLNDRFEHIGFDIMILYGFSRIFTKGGYYVVFQRENP